MTSHRALVLVSGGLDSTTTLAIARDQRFECYALSVDYGQRHAAELDAAMRVAEALGAQEHRIMRLDLAGIGGSALTDETIAVPTSPVPGDIPVTYVPFRNAHFLSVAVSWAEVLGAAKIYIGAVEPDSSGYPDCRPSFIAAFQATARLGTRLTDLTVRAPLLHLTKAEIIAKGQSLGVDFGMTRTCYAPDDAGRACGRCDACRLRLTGFYERGLVDTAPYVTR